MFSDLCTLSASVYFDPDWYLARYPDVAHSGAHPILHYLTEGAAEGLDPGPLFSTSSYVAAHPHIDFSHVNPLVYFVEEGLRAGDVRGSIAAFRKRQSPCVSPQEIRELAAAYSQPRAMPPKADDHNVFELREDWSEFFLFSGHSSLRRKDEVQALDAFHRSYQVRPESDDAYKLFTHHFRRRNAGVFAYYENAIEGAAIVVAHVTCRHKVGLAADSAASFEGRDIHGIANIIVYGDPHLDPYTYHFDEKSRTLTVPAADSYEGLPMKVSAYLRFAGLSTSSTPVLKVDDDIRCVDPQGLLSELPTLASCDYAGRVFPSPSRFTDCHFWHFLKTQDTEVGMRPDGLFFRPYVAGPYYYLGGDALNLAARTTLLHEAWFQSEFYEDRSLGTALSYYGVRPQHWNAVEKGILTELSHP